MNRAEFLERLVADLGRPRSKLVRQVSSEDIDSTALSQRLRSLGYAVAEWSAEGSVNPDFDLMRAMIRELKMTDVYSVNWNAVSETLDAWADGKPPPTAVVVSHAKEFREGSPIQWKVALDVLNDCGKEWRRKGHILRALFIT